MKTPQITPAWNTGIYIGDGVIAQRDEHTVIVNGKTIYSGTDEHKADAVYCDNERLGVSSQWLVNGNIYIEMEV